jgi:hypothetical protein
MTNREKIELLNAIPVDDYQCDGSTCYYVEARLEDAEATLKQIGVNHDYINRNARYLPEDDYHVIDLNPIGFGMLGATWWSNADGYTFR